MNNFVILKNNKKNPEDKTPDYRISVKDGEKFVEAGGCWLKESEKGKYFSCKLSLPYKDRKGWTLTPIEQQVAEVKKEDELAPF